MPFEIYVYDTVECKGLETNKFIIVIFLHFELYAKEYKNAKYINDEKDVEVLNTRSEIFKTNYPWYFASNKYLWLYDDNELILKDESFMTIFNIKGKYEPLTVFIDEECVIKNDSILFIFNSITKKMKEIRD